MNGRPWTRAERKLLREYYAWIPTKEIAEDLGRGLTTVYQQAAKLGLVKSEEYLASPDACRLRRGDNVGAAHRYPKGHVPANKGLRRPGFAPGRMRETQWKKGQCGWNWRPVGALRTCAGYLYRKIADKRRVPWTRNWVLEHRRIWEKKHGCRINWRTHALVFQDGDPTHVKLGNLELITRKELRYRNSIHCLPPELKEVIRLKATINQVITKRERKMRHAEEQAERSA